MWSAAEVEVSVFGLDLPKIVLPAKYAACGFQPIEFVEIKNKEGRTVEAYWARIEISKEQAT